MKSLQTIQKTFRGFQILTKIAMIFPMFGRGWQRWGCCVRLSGMAAAPLPALTQGCCMP